MITRSRSIAAILIASILGPAPFAGATHQVDHRVTVRGAVYESDGTPRARAPISLVDPGGKIIGTTETSRNATYEFNLHLHDEDAGRILIFRSGEISQEFRLVFDPTNTRKERIVTVTIGEIAPELHRRQLILTGAGIAAITAIAAAGALVLSRKKRHRDTSKGKHPRGSTGKRSSTAVTRRSPTSKAGPGGRKPAPSDGTIAGGKRRSGSKRH